METEINENKTTANAVVKEEVTETSLKITSDGKYFLISTSKWANFIAIIGFVMLGLMVVFSVSTFVLSPVMGDFQDFQAIPFPLYFIGIIYLIYAIIGFIPYYFLYSFAKKVRRGLESSNQSTFDSGLNNLRRLALFVGILMIISLCMILLIIPVGVFTFGMLQSLSGGTMI